MKLTNKKNYIAPSILSADLANLGQEVIDVLNAGADIIHFDVMDNHYVPNLTFGPVVLEKLKKYLDNNKSKLEKNYLIDVHLMTNPVDNLISDFAKAGADMISFHPEASLHIDRSIDLIKSYNIKAGVVLNPATSLNCLDYILDKLDYVLIMSVNPGFAGQKFINSSLDKVKKLKEIINNKNLDITISIDGGVSVDNIAKISKAGVNMFVAGSAIYNAGSPVEYTNIINKMRDNI